MENITELEKAAVFYYVRSGCKDRNLVYQLANNPDKFNKLTNNSKAVTVSRWFNRPDIQERIKLEIYTQEKERQEQHDKIVSSFAAAEEPEGLQKTSPEAVNFLDRDEFLKFLNARANEIQDDKLRNDILKMLSDNLRYKDGEGDETTEIQRFYTPLLCKDCQLYIKERDKLSQ